MPRTLKSSRPEIHRIRGKLVWLVPILIASASFFAVYVRPAAFMNDRVFFSLLILYGLVAPRGGLWAIYQSIRYEKDPWKCIAVVVFVPFGFLWYWFERYQKRLKDSDGAVRDDKTRQ